MSRINFPRFLRPAETVAGAALVIAVLSVLSRVLGVVRDRILAGTFGAGHTLDMYYAAFRFPDLIFNLLVLGALSAGFIPMFTSLWSGEERERAWRLTNNILNILCALLALLCGLGIIGAPLIVRLVAPGFAPETLPTLITLTRIMFLSPFLLGLSSIVGSVLQSRRRFFVYSLSPIFYNLGIIAGALLLVPRFGVTGLGWGVALGSLAHLAVQLPTFRGLGFHYQKVFDWRDKSVRAVFRMMSARTIGLAVTQINLMVITIIASTLATGSLTVFNLANNLQSFPVSIFGISFALAVFPLMSAKPTPENITTLFSRTFRQIMFFIIPAMVIMLSLRAHVVRLVLGSGQFDWNATILTVDTLALFIISFFAQATLPLLTRSFYAQSNSRTPLYAGLVAEVANVSLTLYFARLYGAPGLALGFSLSSIINFSLLFILLRRSVGNLDEKRIIRSVFKYTVAAICATIAIQAMKLLIWPYADLTRFWGVLLQASAAGLFGSLVYLAVCSLLKSEEFIELWQAFKQRFGVKRPKLEIDDQGEARGI